MSILKFLFASSTLNFIKTNRSMAVFTQVLNPIKGQNEWVSKEDTYDYHQEVANAGFGDMLHDTERNSKYYKALRKTIALLHSQGREAHVLDIGTGTGILSMMAVESGADSVTACEAFMPMANCAERILEINGMKDKVKLIKKRSTDIIMGKDMPRRANLLVTEVLDTELIGEGAIGIYNHAHDQLLTDDAVCIPAFAICYAQVAQSPLAAQWNSLKILANLDGDVLLKPPKDITECKGEANLHDVQLSQLPKEQWQCISKPLEIFKFDFSSKKRRETERFKNIVVKPSGTGSTDLVFYWWDIAMDEQSEIKLSCAPYWAHAELKDLAHENYPAKPLPNVVPWRDHWMQAIYYIPKPLNVFRPDKEFILNCNHDEYSLWFDIFPQSLSEDSSNKTCKRHQCSCMLHTSYPRSRIGQMNQGIRNKKYLNYLESCISGSSEVLVLGDACYIGLVCSPLGAKKVWCLEQHLYSRYFMESVAKSNKLENVEFIEKLEDLESYKLQELTHIFAEPYFLTSILPWDNFFFGTLLMKIQPRLSSDIKISPHAARIWAVPVEFLDLHKIRKPVGECEGFDLQLFDEMVEKSMSVVQSKVEAQPLWEYPCKALAESQKLLEVVFNCFDTAQSIRGNIPIEFSSYCNGIVLWVEWLIDDTCSPKSYVSTGPTEPIVVGDFIKWDMFVRQGVHLMGKDHQVQKGKSKVLWKIEFEPKLGVLDFKFKIST